MRNGFIILLTAWTGAQLLSAAESTNAPAALFKDEREKASYAIGVSVGSNLKRGNFDVDLDVLTQAIRDTLAGRDLKLNDQQVRETLMAYQKSMQQRTIDKNRKEGEAFLAENKKKAGVQVLPVKLVDGVMAELQYKVLAEGSGESPKSNDVVSVNYRGTLINGTEFDSSAKHGGKPAQFAANRVVRGWTEALTRMKPGSKWQLFIPSNLAYGDGGRPGIEPASTLIFDVELVSFEAPPAPPSAASQPALTSDIVRVPSADEMKAGAKIEVIKPEDLEKLKNSATNAPKTAPRK